MTTTHYLWQRITKEHLDPDDKLSNDEWEQFVERFQQGFAEEASECAKEMFQNFLSEKEDEKTEECCWNLDVWQLGKSERPWGLFSKNLN